MDAQTTFEEKAAKTLSVLKEELVSIRAGKANPGILNKVMVNYYGQETPLKNIANISAPDPRTLMISPFDPKSISEIEKAINVANIGINPSNDGKVIRLAIPQVTEERRKELTKLVKKTGEDAKVAVRNIRRDLNEDLKKQEKNGEITEDDLKNDLEDIQKKSDKAIKEIDELVAAKEKEIMEI